ncbi:phasin family protein [Micromonospora sp. CPCC 206061]|uniref:phasin family protein n=1 Tax=Micromonospora sp. CPCC 206061 TaxID=3122410 RepID=UPI003FA53C35
MEAWRAYLELALGLTEASRKKAQKAAKKLVGKGGATAGQLQAMAEELVATSVANREALTKLVRFEVDRALGKVGLATSDEVADLTARVRELEEELRTTKTAPAAAAAPASSTPSAPAKKAVAKKTVAKKAVAKKAPAEVAPAVKAAPEAAAPGAAEPAAPPAKKTAPTKKTAPAKKAVPTVDNATPEPGSAAAATPVDSPVAPAKKTKTVAKKAPARKTSPAKKAAPPPAGDA